mgnify:CR=1 FL=1
MSIRWNPQEVRDLLDEIETIFKVVEPYLGDAQALAMKATRVENLPGYMSSTLARLGNVLREQVAQAEKQIEYARGNLPDQKVFKGGPRPKEVEEVTAGAKLL